MANAGMQQENFEQADAAVQKEKQKPDLSLVEMSAVQTKVKKLIIAAQDGPVYGELVREGRSYLSGMIKEDKAVLGKLDQFLDIFDNGNDLRSAYLKLLFFLKERIKLYENKECGEYLIIAEFIKDQVSLMRQIDVHTYDDLTSSL